MAGAADYTAPEDPDEPVIAVTGKHAFPRHPATMKEPYVYKLTFLGPAGAGKTAVASRLVAHNFDPTYRPTLVPQQLFWRHHEEDSGRDILVEIEDVPGIPGAIIVNQGEMLTRWSRGRLKPPIHRVLSESVAYSPVGAGSWESILIELLFSDTVPPCLTH